MAIAQSTQAQCQSAQIHFCVLAHISSQKPLYMHINAICKPTTWCSQFYHPHCYEIESSSSNQCLDSMALMVGATHEPGTYLMGATTRRTPLIVPTGASESVATSNSDSNGDRVNKFQNWTDADISNQLEKRWVEIKNPNHVIYNSGSIICITLSWSCTCWQKLIFISWLLVNSVNTYKRFQGLHEK